MLVTNVLVAGSMMHPLVLLFGGSTASGVEDA